MVSLYNLECKGSITLSSNQPNDSNNQTYIFHVYWNMAMNVIQATKAQNRLLKYPLSVTARTTSFSFCSTEVRIFYEMPLEWKSLVSVCSVGAMLIYIYIYIYIIYYIPISTYIYIIYIYAYLYIYVYIYIYIYIYAYLYIDNYVALT